MRIAFPCALFGAVALSLGVSSPGRAQLQPEVLTGHQIHTDPALVESRRAAAVEYAFARCIYRENSRIALALLMHSDPLTTDLAAAGIKDVNKALGMEKCLGREAYNNEVALGLKMPMPVLRTMLAEQSYLATQQQAPAPAEVAIAAESRRFVSTGDQLSKATAIAIVADCLVFHDVLKADALLRSEPGSPAEYSIAIALAPAIGSCLTQGFQLRLNSRAIRSLVADGLWNRYVRPTVAN